MKCKYEIKVHFAKFDDILAWTKLETFGISDIISRIKQESEKK